MDIWDKNKPRAYKLESPSDVRRLYREVHGYLKACAYDHHGTDLAGRQFAIDALAMLMKATPATGIAARSDETPQAAQPREGQEEDPTS